MRASTTTTRALVATVVITGACSAQPTPPTTSGATSDSQPTSSLATPTTAQPPPAVDVGVDLEAGIVRLAVVGAVSDDLWQGHFSYWKAVNDDLGGVGGSFEVELVQVDSIEDARAVGALAVSIDASGSTRPLLDMLAVQPRDGNAVDGRIDDLTARSADVALDAARRSFASGSGVLDPAAYAGEVLVTDDSRCPVVADTLEIDRVDVGAIPAYPEPTVFYLCVGVANTLSAAAEALGAGPGSALIIPGAAWRPELASQLAGSPVTVIGYVPEPGVDGAPASDVMGLVLGEGPWSGDLVDGYTLALTVHAALEAALAGANLTRASVREAVGLESLDLGFGDRMAIAELDTGSPTGLRLVAWVNTP